MNVENINKLIEVLKSESLVEDTGVGFNMHHTIKIRPRCRTVACIAGHAALLKHGYSQVLEVHNREEIEEEAAQWMGLDLDLAFKVFYPSSVAGYRAPSSVAVDLLEKIRDGKVKTEEDVSAYWQNLGLEEKAS